MNNIYLGIILYSKSKKLKNLFVLDFNKKIMYCGSDSIKSRIEDFFYENNNPNKFDYFIPIIDNNTLNKILSSDFNLLSNIGINKTLKRFNLEEYII